MSESAFEASSEMNPVASVGWESEACPPSHGLAAPMVGTAQARLCPPYASEGIAL